MISSKVARSRVVEWSLKGLDGREHALGLHYSRLISVGRDPTSDVRVLDAGVSRHHATLTLEDGELWVEDLHSHNGTFVNSERVRRSVLNEGDIVTFGRVHLTVHRQERERTIARDLFETLEAEAKIELLDVARSLTRASPAPTRLRRALEHVRGRQGGQAREGWRRAHARPAGAQPGRWR